MVAAAEMSAYERQSVKIVALTASVFEEKREAVMAAGCDDFVRKPFPDHVIFDKLADYLHVRYEYAKPDLLLTSPSPTRQAPLITSEALSMMPSEWLEQLHSAAVQADAGLLQQCVQSLPTDYASLGEALTGLINSYDYDSIIEAIEGLMSQSA